MASESRFKKFLSPTKASTGSGSFDYYYGLILQDQPDGGLHAGDARRDFEKVHKTIFLVSTYS